MLGNLEHLVVFSVIHTVLTLGLDFLDSLGCFSPVAFGLVFYFIGVTPSLSPGC